MKVLLTETLDKIGIVGEVIEVSDGFARNYLLPKKLGIQPTEGNIKRLEIDPRRIEETETRGTSVIVVAVHSHADLRAAVATVHADRVAVVAMPCCVPQELDTKPDIVYEDYGCLSPRRTVKVWRDYRTER